MPYLPNDRQYREFAASNFEPVKRNAEGGESSEPSYVVRGHYTIFEREYPLFPGFFETIDRHALDNTDMSDVIFQFNHRDMVLARQRNGSLQVGIDPDGGWCEADLSGCQQGRDLYEAITNGLIDRMSFGFTIAEDGVEWEEDDEGNIHSRITNIHKLFDVSAVDLPASEFTDISARSYADSIIEARNKVLEEKAAAEAAEAAEQERLAQEAAEAEERAVQEAVEAERRQALEMLKLRARAMGLAD